jgi:hypothetical protein
MQLYEPFANIPESASSFVAKIIHKLKCNKILFLPGENVLPILFEDLGLGNKIDAVLNRRLPKAIESGLFSEFFEPIRFIKKDNIEAVSEEERYDLILGFPPLGVNFIKGSSPLDIIMDYNLLAQNGIGLFLVSPNFFHNHKGSGKNALLEAGFQISASFEIPTGSFPHSGVSASLIVIKSGTSDEIFSAKISPEPKNQDKIISNWINSTTSPNPEIGIQVNIGDFHGNKSLISAYQAELLAKKMGFTKYKFSKVVTGFSSTPSDTRKFERLEHVENSVYLPRMWGQVKANQEDLSERLKSYYQICLDPNIADSSFVQLLFQHKLGRLMFESVARGSTMPAINKSSLQKMNFYLPGLPLQKSITSAFDSIRDADNQLQEIKRNIWNSPEDLDRIMKKIEAFEPKNAVDFLIEEFPFPLASILQLYKSYPETSNKERFETLLQFFEALSIFTSVIHISAWKTNPNEWHDKWSKFKNKLDENNKNWLDKPDFGTWNSINSYFSKRYRTELNNKEKTDFLNAIYHNIDRDLLTALSSKEYNKILDIVRVLRNKHKGHTGVISDSVAMKINEELLNNLNNIRDCLGSNLHSLSMFIPGLGGQTDSGFKCEIKKLDGATTPFLSGKVTLTEAPMMNRLYLHTPHSLNALLLIPLLKLGPSPPNVANACYFYGGVDDGEHRFLSYHYKEKAETLEYDLLAEHAINFLRKEE